VSLGFLVEPLLRSASGEAVRLFTWNVKGREYIARIALSYLDALAKDDHVVAAFQEWPKNPTTITGLSGPDLELSNPSGIAEGQVVMVHSRGIQCRSASFVAGGRALSCNYEIRSTGTIFWAVGVHWYCRDSRLGIDDHFKRGGAAALFRVGLDRVLPPNVPFVIMGDFNIAPNTLEFTSEYCLFVSTRKARHSWPCSVLGQQKTPWILVDPPADGPESYYYKKDKTRQSFDHIVLSLDLQKSRASAQVMDAIDIPGAAPLSLVTKIARYPDAERASDHLPVLCTLHLQ
jgi:exonuclease III